MTTPEFIHWYGYAKMPGTADVFFRREDVRRFELGWDGAYSSPARLVQDIAERGSFHHPGRAPLGDYIQVDIEKAGEDYPANFDNDGTMEYVLPASAYSVITHTQALAIQRAALIDLAEHSVGLQYDLIEFDGSIVESLTTAGRLLKGMVGTFADPHKANFEIILDQFTIAVSRMTRRLDRQTIRGQLIGGLVVHMSEGHREEDDFLAVHRQYVAPLAAWIEKEGTKRADAALVKAHPDKTAAEIRAASLLTSEVAQKDHEQFNAVLSEWTKTYIPRSDFKKLTGFHSNVETRKVGNREYTKTHHHWSVASLDTIKKRLDAAIAAETAEEAEE